MDKQWSTKHIYKTNDRVTGTPLQTGENSRPYVFSFMLWCPLWFPHKTIFDLSWSQFGFMFFLTLFELLSHILATITIFISDEVRVIKQ
jgi:hypothetical protein